MKTEKQQIAKLYQENEFLKSRVQKLEDGLSDLREEVRNHRLEKAKSELAALKSINMALGGSND